MNDQEIEKEIQAKGLTAPRVSLQQIEEAIQGETYTVLPSGRATICEMTLKNGYVVIGQSLCVSRENFNAELGQKISREDAKQKIWPLLGYALRDALYNGAGM
jgi:Phage protein (N4 Gp49/phage Sf6 gene 66) family